MVRARLMAKVWIKIILYCKIFVRRTSLRLFTYEITDRETKLPAGQPLAVVFTVLTQVYCPKI